MECMTRRILHRQSNGQVRVQELGSQLLRSFVPWISPARALDPYRFIIRARFRSIAYPKGQGLSRGQEIIQKFPRSWVGIWNVLHTIPFCQWLPKLSTFLHIDLRSLSRRAPHHVRSPGHPHEGERGNPTRSSPGSFSHRDLVEPVSGATGSVALYRCGL